MANKTFNLSQEAYDQIMDYKGNKSELVTNLLLSHFNEETSIDPEKLLKKKQELFNERKILDLKITQLDETINAVKEKDRVEEEKKRMAKALKDYKEEFEVWNKKWQNEEIDDDTYWAGVEERENYKKEILAGIKKENI